MFANQRDKKVPEKCDHRKMMKNQQLAETQQKFILL